MQNNKTKRYYILLLLLLTGIMTTTSTYAWLTTTRMLYIDTMNIKAEAKGGLEISVDGNAWATSVTGLDIKKAIETYPRAINLLPTTLEPTSTAGYVNLVNNRMEMYYGDTYNSQDNYNLATYRLDDVDTFNKKQTSKYIVFDVFIKLNGGANAGNGFYLTNDSGAIYSGDQTPGIENAIRFGFIILGNTPTNSSLENIQGLNNNKNPKAYIWEPNYDVHNTTAIENAKNVYNIEVKESGNARLKYDGVKSSISSNENISLTDANSSKYPKYFEMVNVDFITPQKAIENTKIFNINEGITKIRIYIWLEGQDVDCENYSAAGNIDFNIGFTTNPKN